MDFFGRRARREAQIRKEAAAATRKELVSALVDIPLLITEHKTEWHETLTNKVYRAINHWFESRTEDRKRALRESFQQQVNLLLGRMPSAMIRKLAEAYRRNLIWNIGEQAKALFVASIQRRSDELLTAVKEEVERNRGPVTSSEEALPNGTRFFFRTTNGSQVYVVEQPPTVRTIQYRRDRYRLAFPFVVMLVHFDSYGDFASLHVFFRNERLKKVSDTLCTAALPNIGDSGSVCFPGLLDADTNLSLTDKVERVMDSFWGSGFNTDLSSDFEDSMGRIRQIRSLSHWQKESAKNPQFVLSLDWLPSRRRTLDKYIQYICEDRQREAESNTFHMFSRSLNRAAERVGADAMESAAQLISGWKIDEAPSKVLSDELGKLLSEGAGGLTGMVDNAANEIFAKIPDLGPIEAEGEQFKKRLAEEVDKRIGWIGLV